MLLLGWGSICFVYCPDFLVMLGIEPRVLLRRESALPLRLIHSPGQFCFVLKQGLAMYPKLTLNMESFYCSLPSVVVTGMCQHIWPYW